MSKRETRNTFGKQGLKGKIENALNDIYTKYEGEPRSKKVKSFLTVEEEKMFIEIVAEIVLKKAKEINNEPIQTNNNNKNITCASFHDEQKSTYNLQVLYSGEKFPLCEFRILDIGFLSAKTNIALIKNDTSGIIYYEFVPAEGLTLKEFKEVLSNKLSYRLGFVKRDRNSRKTTVKVIVPPPPNEKNQTNTSNGQKNQTNTSTVQTNPTNTSTVQTNPTNTSTVQKNQTKTNNVQKNQTKTNYVQKNQTKTNYVQTNLTNTSNILPPPPPVQNPSNILPPQPPNKTNPTKTNNVQKNPTNISTTTNPIIMGGKKKRRVKK